MGMIEALWLNNIDFSMCLENVMKRNNNSFHITVFNVAECNKNPVLLDFDGFLIIEDIINKGIGFISKNDIITQENKFTFFNVVESIGLTKMREHLNLKIKDFHVTIGFTHTDLFHEAKNNPNLFQLSI